MPFDDESFDGVLCCAAFKNFAEPVRAIQEMFPVLRPGGRALVLDLRRDDVPKPELDEEIARMGLGPANRAITRYALGSWLPRRAHTKQEFEGYIATTNCSSFEVREERIGVEVEMDK
jgi:ubiquinone/menaquinone biosynthesis C-methylase UbiE